MAQNPLGRSPLPCVSRFGNEAKTPVASTTKTTVPINIPVLTFVPRINFTI